MKPSDPFPPILSSGSCASHPPRWCRLTLTWVCRASTCPPRWRSVALLRPSPSRHRALVPEQGPPTRDEPHLLHRFPRSARPRDTCSGLGVPTPNAPASQRVAPAVQDTMLPPELGLGSVRQLHRVFSNHHLKCMGKRWGAQVPIPGSWDGWGVGVGVGESAPLSALPPPSVHSLSLK